MQWKAIAERVGVAPTTAMYLYQCEPTSEPIACGPRRAVIATQLGEMRFAWNRIAANASARIRKAPALGHWHISIRYPISGYFDELS